jgi:hypothetical protein
MVTATDRLGEQPGGIQPEAGEELGSEDAVLFKRQQLETAVAKAMELAVLPGGVDDPVFPDRRTLVEILLTRVIAGPAVGRDDLNGNVRGTLAARISHDVQPIGRDERDVRLGGAPRLEHERHAGAEGLSRLSFLGVALEQKADEVADLVASEGIGRGRHDFAVDEVRLLAVLHQAEELLNGVRP